jgi:hypothetical protein
LKARIAQEHPLLIFSKPPLSGKLSARFDPSTRGPNRRP